MTFEGRRGELHTCSDEALDHAEDEEGSEEGDEVFLIEVGGDMDMCADVYHPTAAHCVERALAEAEHKHFRE